MVLTMVIFAALLLWLLLVLFGGWWLTRLAEPATDAPTRIDPFAEEMRQWRRQVHDATRDWDGRA